MYGEEITLKQKPVRKRESVHLKWYERQWGSGFIAGLWLGTMTGMPLAFLVYKLAVVTVRYISAS